jgi:hypothetical protein
MHKVIICVTYTLFNYTCGSSPWSQAPVHRAPVALGVLLVLLGHPAVGLVIGDVGMLVIGGDGFLLMRFSRCRTDRFEARLSAA